MFVGINNQIFYFIPEWDSEFRELDTAVGMLAEQFAGAELESLVR